MKQLGALMMAMLLFAPAGQAESAPLLYRVTDGAGHEAYLMGTIHVGEEDMYPLGEAMEAAYARCDILAVEADALALASDPALAAQYTRGVTLEDGDAAGNHLSPETYDLGVRALGQRKAVLDRLIPMAWYSMAEEALYARLGLTAEWGVDRTLLKRAREDGKQVDEWEGVQGQLAVMRAVPDEIVDWELGTLLRDPEGQAEAFRALADAWMRGDESALVSLLNAEENGLPDDLRAAWDQYRALLYTARNDAFEARIREYLSGNHIVLAALGSAHIVGEDGLSARLERAGYTVEEIGRPKQGGK